MASFATFAVGFRAPLGGVIFGHLGDRIGRKKALMTTLMMMGVATVCVGLLPDYSKVGMLAPVLLSSRCAWCRDRGRRRMGRCGADGGRACAAGASHVLRVVRAARQPGRADPVADRVPRGHVDGQGRLRAGWRLPFLASSVLLVVGILIRLGVNESPEFARVKEAHRTVKLPVAEVFCPRRGLVALCIGANTIGIAGVYFTNTFMIAYTTQYVGVSRLADPRQPVRGRDHPVRRAADRRMDRRAHLAARAS